MRGSAFEAEGIACVKTLSRERIEYLKTWFEEFIEKQLARGVGSEGLAPARWAVAGLHSFVGHSLDSTLRALKAIIVLSLGVSFFLRGF